MRTVIRPRSLALLTLLGLLAMATGLHLLAQQQTPPAKENPVGTKETPVKPEYRITGPFTHNNLTVFLIHGKDDLKIKDFLLLPEALEAKKAVIHETQSVNQLQVENLSDKEIILLSGDLLSGGQQDRVVTYDMILPPKSGKVDLAVFCVEHTASRWMEKLTPENKKFDGSFDVLASKDLRLANCLHMDQHKVWLKVEMAQRKLVQNLSEKVVDAKSPSSLQLTLKVEEVQKAANAYNAEFDKITKGKTDVVGYAFAINGKVYGADVYGSNALFQKVWPRLIRANAIEAVADLEKDKKYPSVAVADVEKFLADARSGKTSQKDVGNGVFRYECQGERNAVFESIDPQRKMCIRGLYLAY